MLIMVDDMIANIKSNKKISSIVAELLLRGGKLNISLVFISQFCFKLAKTIRLKATDYFIIKMPQR